MLRTILFCPQIAQTIVIGVILRKIVGIELLWVRGLYIGFLYLLLGK